MQQLTEKPSLYISTQKSGGGHEKKQKASHEAQISSSQSLVTSC
mgnify:CR=1 FL=1